ncbi:TPA: major capsid family protein [Serratia marcescens]|uniref:DUF2184 domain-containing protein n=1 Tax=Serratia nevei TaxID=2703794 RepID=A0AAW6WZT4_9GAMM|nr:MULTISPECIES: major capsid family protein [Serratia]APS35495.1 hypothetical protein RN42_17305 [Serratia marcescens]MDK4764231.1 DUF2184 domain-containing protein [Serratia nevei]MDK4771701.1 DUF2184 domain-containing protein [Serratia nevei]MDK4794171.1 DUF2184 domain-containing protein [Serratia nevei]MDK4856471.1 DUF2184 domain-containing protein [Serratia nevei]
MPAITPSYQIVNPSYIMPEMILSYQQASGAFSVMASGNPLVRLSEGDQYVYMKRLDIRTQVTSSQSGNANQLPSVALDARMISTPTYMFRARAIYDHHDMAAAGNWGIALPEAQRLGTRQAIFQQLRGALLYGMNPAGGEGVLNTNGATTISLPADSNGNTTVLTYDHGQMAVFLLAQIQAIRTRTMQMGRPSRMVILGPQRTLGTMEMQQIVQLTSYQRPGGGTSTVKGTVANVADEADCGIDWVYDDTLIGAGANGTDAIIIAMPEVERPEVNAKINTNEFAKLSPSLEATSLMLCDMAAPREIPTPIAGGAIDVLSEMRSTSGWVLRPEALTVISMKYSD